MSTIEHPQYLPPQPVEPEYRVRAWQWVVAVLFPLVGIILGIVALARKQGAQGAGLIVASIVSWILWVVVIAAMAASSVVGEDATPSASTAAIEQALDTTDVQSASDAVDFLGDDFVTATCDLDAVMGGDGAGRDDFVSGFDSTAPADGPSGDEVYDEIMSRC